ncbi:MAG: NAD-dependent epimerase/dehydratase family protein [Bacteroidota bacterium]
MRVLLTGATGFLGYRTLERLSVNPGITNIIAAGRTIKESHFVNDSKIEYQLGDLCDKNYVNRITRNIDCVIHAAALSSPWGKYEDFEKANIYSQKNCILAAIENQVKKYIYVSSPGIYFTGEDRIDIKETDKLPKKFINDYAKTKHAAELELMHAGIPYIILRPRGIIGRGDTVIMPRLVKAFEAGRLKIIGNGKNIVDLSSALNVAYAIELALFCEKGALNQDYNITNDEPVLLWEYIENMLKRLGYRFPKTKVSFRLVKFIAGLMELQSKLTNNSEPTLTKYGVGTLAKSFTMDISKAKYLLRYKPLMNTAEAMDEFAVWHLNKK